jgi:hypothetical protein
MERVRPKEWQRDQALLYLYKVYLGTAHVQGLRFARDGKCIAFKKLEESDQMLLGVFLHPEEEDFRS